VPRLHRYGVEVVAFGPSMLDDDHAILIRFFRSLEERKESSPGSTGAKSG
jgi:hypothetical protein